MSSKEDDETTQSQADPQSDEESFQDPSAAATEDADKASGDTDADVEATQEIDAEVAQETDIEVAQEIDTDIAQETDAEVDVSKAAPPTNPDATAPADLDQRADDPDPNGDVYARLRYMHRKLNALDKDFNRYKKNHRENLGILIKAQQSKDIVRKMLQGIRAEVDEGYEEADDDKLNWSDDDELQEAIAASLQSAENANAKANGASAKEDDAQDDPDRDEYTISEAKRLGEICEECALTNRDENEWDLRRCQGPSCPVWAHTRSRCSFLPPGKRVSRSWTFYCRKHEGLAKPDAGPDGGHNKVPAAKRKRDPDDNYTDDDVAEAKKPVKKDPKKTPKRPLRQPKDETKTAPTSGRTTRQTAVANKPQEPDQPIDKSKCHACDTPFTPQNPRKACVMISGDCETLTHLGKKCSGVSNLGRFAMWLCPKHTGKAQILTSGKPHGGGAQGEKATDKDPKEDQSKPPPGGTGGSSRQSGKSSHKTIPQSGSKTKKNALTTSTPIVDADESMIKDICYHCKDPAGIGPKSKGDLKHGSQRSSGCKSFTHLGEDCSKVRGGLGPREPWTCPDHDEIEVEEEEAAFVKPEPIAKPVAKPVAKPAPKTDAAQPKKGAATPVVKEKAPAAKTAYASVKKTGGLPKQKIIEQIEISDDKDCNTSSSGDEASPPETVEPPKQESAHKSHKHHLATETAQSKIFKPAPKLVANNTPSDLLDMSDSEEGSEPHKRITPPGLTPAEIKKERHHRRISKTFGLSNNKSKSRTSTPQPDSRSARSTVILLKKLPNAGGGRKEEAARLAAYVKGRQSAQAEDHADDSGAEKSAAKKRKVVDDGDEPREKKSRKVGTDSKQETRYHFEKFENEIEDVDEEEEEEEEEPKKDRKNRE